MNLMAVSWRNAIANRSEFVLTAVAIVLSIAFLTATLIVANSITGTAETDIADANANVAFVVEGATVTESGGGPGEATGRVSTLLPPELVSEAMKISGVDSAAGETVGFAKLVANGEAVGAGTATDVGMGWISEPHLNPFRLVEGSAPIGPNQVVLPPKLARDGNVGVGDAVQVLTPSGLRQATVSGLATFASAESAPLSRVVLFDDEVAADMLSQQGLIRIRIAVEAEADLERIGSSLGALGPDLVVLDNAEFVAGQQRAVGSPFAFLSAFLIAFAAIATVAGITIIFNTLVIAMRQRRREFALMRAIGTQRRQVMRTVLAESTLIALAASAGGVVLGIVSARVLRQVMDVAGLSFLDGPLVATPAMISLAFSVGVIVTIASAWGPTRAAAGAAPIEALREATAEPAVVSRFRSGAGIVFLTGGLGLTVIAGVTENSLLLGGVAFLVLGFVLAGPLIVTGIAAFTRPLSTWLLGVTGSIASTNLSRNPRRASSTSLGLTLGVSLVAFFAIVASSISASFASSLDTQVRADTVSLSASPDVATIDPGLVGRLSAIPGATAASLAVAEGSVGGEGALVGGMDAELAQLFDFAVIAGSLDELERTGEDRAAGIAVWSGVDVVPGLGETVQLTLRSGTVGLPVVAVFDETLAGFDSPEYLISADHLETLEPGLPDWIVFASGADETVRQSLRAGIADTPGALFESRDSYVGNAGAEINALRNLIYALLGLTVVIAVLGVANTTALSITERVREIGLMRAIGTTPADVRRVIRWEALILALFGTLSGVAMATVAGWAFVRAAGGADISIVAVPWVVFAVLTVGAVGSSVAATVVPAHRASRIPTLDAIASN